MKEWFMDSSDKNRILLEGILALVVGTLVVATVDNELAQIIGRIIQGSGVLVTLAAYFLFKEQPEKQSEITEVSITPTFSFNDKLGMVLLISGLIFTLIGFMTGLELGFIDLIKPFSIANIEWPLLDISPALFIIFVGTFLLFYFLAYEFILSKFGKNSLINLHLLFRELGTIIRRK